MKVTLPVPGLALRQALAGALCLAVLLTGEAAQAAGWTDLWSTPEQQGERLLQQHQPAEAARHFSDPRRRAYAQLQAGQYAQAADLLKPFDDADSQYNRGNALAHQGQLKEALAAYDAALAKAPKDPDIRRNRDLVARAMDPQKPPPQQQQGGQGGNGQNKDDPGKNGQDKQGQGQGQEQGQPGQNGPSGPEQGNSPKNGDKGQQGQSAQNRQSGPDRNRQDRNGQDHNGQGQSGQSSQANQPGGGPDSRQAGASSSAAGTSGSAAQQTPGGQQAGAGRAATQQSAGQTGPAAAQADAAAGAHYAQDNKSADSQALAHARAGAEDVRPAPPSEQALALDQWLQRIPEDSGELLRRKFLIEHMMRQQREEPQP